MNIYNDSCNTLNYHLQWDKFMYISIKNICINIRAFEVHFIQKCNFQRPVSPNLLLKFFNFNTTFKILK